MKVWAKTKEFSEGKFLVVRRDGTVPVWPHFVLGARDKAAPVALQAYADAQEKYGADPEYVASIRELATDFEAYRIREGNGDPDASPHRVDNDSVLHAMRGNPATINVRPGPNKGKALPAPAKPVFRVYGASDDLIECEPEWVNGGRIAGAPPSAKAQAARDIAALDPRCPTKTVAEVAAERGYTLPGGLKVNAPPEGWVAPVVGRGRLVEVEVRAEGTVAFITDADGVQMVFDVEPFAHLAWPIDALVEVRRGWDWKNRVTLAPGARVADRPRLAMEGVS